MGDKLNGVAVATAREWRYAGRRLSRVAERSTALVFRDDRCPPRDVDHPHGPSPADSILSLPLPAVVTRTNGPKRVIRRRCVDPDAPVLRSRESSGNGARGGSKRRLSGVPAADAPRSLGQRPYGTCRVAGLRSVRNRGASDRTGRACGSKRRTGSAARAARTVGDGGCTSRPSGPRSSGAAGRSSRPWWSRPAEPETGDPGRGRAGLPDAISGHRPAASDRPF